MIEGMKRFYFLFLIIIFGASNSHSASFMLNCSITAPTDGSFKSLYFFHRIKRYTGYFIEHKKGENEYNFYGQKIDMTFLDYDCNENRSLTNIDFYNYTCKGDYRQNKYFNKSHTAMISRDDLRVGRIRIMEGAFGEDIDVIDFWDCEKVDDNEAKNQLKTLRENIVKRDKQINGAKQNRSKDNKI
tara:strand:- start:199 stop:756 length:558 start_codon:yes stop_codon:yes gene_type:complete